MLSSRWAADVRQDRAGAVVWVCAAGLMILIMINIMLMLIVVDNRGRIVGVAVVVAAAHTSTGTVVGNAGRLIVVVTDRHGVANLNLLTSEAAMGMASKRALLEDLGDALETVGRLVVCDSALLIGDTAATAVVHLLLVVATGVAAGDGGGGGSVVVDGVAATNTRAKLAAVSQVAVGADHAGRETSSSVAEDDGGDKVEEAKGDGQDAGSHDKAPQRKAKVLGAEDGLVEVAEHVTAENNHGEAEPEKAMAVREGWPRALKVALEEAPLDLCENEEGGNGGGENVSNGVEKEELASDAREDDHNPTGGDDGDQGNDVARAQDIESLVADATQLGVFGKVEHGDGWRWFVVRCLLV